MSIESRRETEYLVFERHQALERGTTYVYSVSSKTGGVKVPEQTLGWIRWYGPWRRYTFQTTPNGVTFDAKCLEEIFSFLNALMKDWKENKQ